MKKFTIILLAVFGMFLSAQTQYTWMEVYNTTDGSALTSIDFLDAENGIAVGANGTVVSTDDGGETWETLNTGYDTDFEGVKYVAQDTIIIVGYGGTILRTTNGGIMWGSIDNPGNNAILYDIDIDSASGSGLIAGSGNLLMWTEDVGASWEFIDGGYMNNYYGAFMANSDFGIVVGRNAIFQPLLGYTQNGGDSWSYQPIYPVFGTTAVEATGYDAYFFNADDGFIAGSTWNGSGFVTNEVNWGSDGWQATELEQPIYAIDFANDNLGVVAGWLGYMAETHNGGATWTQVTTMANREPGKFNDAKLFETTGYAVTENGVVFKKISTTNVGEGPNPVKEFMIYPNPADEGFTSLHLMMNRKTEIAVNVMDMTGRNVMKMKSFDVNQGGEKIRLNTSNLKTGVYLVVVNAGDYNLSEKLAVR